MYRFMKPLVSLTCNSAAMPQSGYIPFNGQSAIDIVPFTTSVPKPQDGYIPYKGQGTYVNNVLSTNNIPMP